MRQRCDSESQRQRCGASGLTLSQRERQPTLYAGGRQSTGENGVLGRGCSEKKLIAVCALRAASRARILKTYRHVLEVYVKVYYCTVAVRSDPPGLH